MGFIMDNISTIVISIVLLTIVVLIIRKMVKDRKSGKCSCGCEGCPQESVCHK